MVNRRRLWTLILAFIMIIQPISAFAEGELPYYGGNPKAPIVMKDNSSEGVPKAGESEINPEFYEKHEGAKVASPLTIHQEAGVSDRTPYGVNLPARYDLREQGRVTAIRDQGPNGSCWAFATYGAMESYLTRQAKYDFSEKHLRNTHGFDWGPNDGGNRDISAAYFSRGSGPIWEKDDPYSPYGYNSPTNLQRVMDIDRVLYIPDMSRGGDTATIKQAIMTYGGVYTTINGSQQYDNTRYDSHYDPGYGQANHAVTIVGWDDNFSRYSFNREAPGNGAWIVRNSWGASYLDNGYYYVSYYDAHCGRGNAVFIPRQKDNTGKIYYYDPLGSTRSIGFSGQGYMANVFRADSNETLHQVGLFNVASNTSYKVYVVRNISQSSDLGSKRQEIASGTMELPGYYTINTNRIGLKQGEQFAIVVYMQNREYSYPLSIETPIRGFSSRASANRGESWISSNGNNWADLTSQYNSSNACIKAITTQSGAAPAPDPVTPNPDPVTPVDPDPTPEPVQPDVVHVNSVRLNYSSAWMYVGYSGRLTATVLPENAANKNITWVSQDTSVASVDSSGLITAKRAGETTITVITADGGYRASCRLSVYNRYGEDNPNPGIDNKVIKTSEIVFNDKKDAGYLPINKIGMLEYTVMPKEASNKAAFCITSNPKVVAVKDGQLIPQSVGQAKITIQAEDKGATKTFTLHVVEAGGKVDGLSSVKIIGDKDNNTPTPPQPDNKNVIALNRDSVRVVAPQTYNVKSALKEIPQNAKLTFKSLNTQIVNVDSRGEITIVKEGAADVTISVENGNTVRLRIETSIPADQYKITGVNASGSKFLWNYTINIRATSSPYEYANLSGVLYIEGSKVTDGYKFSLKDGFGTVKFTSGDVWKIRNQKTLKGKVVIGDFKSDVEISIN